MAGGLWSECGAIQIPLKTCTSHPNSLQVTCHVKNHSPIPHRPPHHMVPRICPRESLSCLYSAASKPRLCLPSQVPRQGRCRPGESREDRRPTGQGGAPPSLLSLSGAPRPGNETWWQRFHPLPGPDPLPVASLIPCNNHPITDAPLWLPSLERWDAAPLPPQPPIGHLFSAKPCIRSW